MQQENIAKCKNNCESSFQDERYGKGNRVHNFSFDKLKMTCTVCSNTRSVQETVGRK